VGFQHFGSVATEHLAQHPAHDLGVVNDEYAKRLFHDLAPAGTGSATKQHRALLVVLPEKASQTNTATAKKRPVASMRAADPVRAGPGPRQPYPAAATETLHFLRYMQGL
jgi:hypothetical protein